MSEGEDNCTKMICSVVNEDEENSVPLCLLFFLHNVLRMFQNTVLKLENNKFTNLELHSTMSILKESLEKRKNDKFYGSAANTLERKFAQEKQRSFERSISYLKKWYDFNDPLHKNLYPVLTQIILLLTGQT